MKLESVTMMQTMLGSAARRRALGGVQAASLLLAVSVASGAAYGQLAVPKYQSPLEAPKPVSTLPAPAPITTNGTVVEYPIVRVNDQIIDNSDYERSARDLVNEAQQKNMGPAELADAQKNLLRDMIDQQLLLSRGKELDINADSEVIRRLDEIRKQNHMDSMEALEKAVRDSGISFEDFKSNIKNQVITQQVVGDEVGRNLRMTAKDEQAYYDAHKEDFAQPEQVRLSEILVPTPDDATDAQVTQAKAKADDVEAKLKAGTKFEDLVKQFSGGPNPDLGGDLGQFKRGQLGSKLLEDPTFALPAGQWTTPIRTRQGFIILKVTEHTPAGVQPLSEVDRQVQEAMYQQAIQPALRTYLTKLRENAYIDIAPGFVDTGASPKETKPVFSGATPPPTKKKTAAQKARMTTGRGATKAPASASSPTPATSPDTTSTGTPAMAAAPTTSPVGKPVSMSANKKPKKVKREKIRFGQAPRDSLPSAPEETLAPGADQGAGATASALAAPGVAIAPTEQASNSDADDNPLTPAVEHKKTRYSDRAPIEAKEKAEKKAAAVKQKAALKPAPLTPEETAAQKAQNAPLGLGGDTATKKKKKREKGQPKERLQQKAPEPPAPKPEATPIPPKSVRDKGEPVVTPVTPPAPGPPIDTPSTQPSTPSNPNPPATQPPTAAPQL